MSRMSQSCFICGKPSVLFYDFLTVEGETQTKNTSSYTLTQSREKVLGIARLTLCKDCLLESLNRMTSRLTDKRGRPRLLEGKKAAELRRFADEIARDIYDKTRDKLTFYDRLIDGLAGIFVASFDIRGIPANFFLFGEYHGFTLDYIPIEKQNPELREIYQVHGPSVPMSRIPDHVTTPLMKRLTDRNLAAQYVLWKSGQNDLTPFAQAIAPEFDGLIRLECMSFRDGNNVLDDAPRTGIPTDFQKLKFAAYDYYLANLMGV